MREHWETTPDDADPTSPPGDEEPKRTETTHEPRCLVCTHVNRAAIEHALLAGSGSLQTIANRYGLTKSSLYRHARNHLDPELRRVIRERPDLAERVSLPAMIESLWATHEEYARQIDYARTLPAGAAVDIVKPAGDGQRKVIETLAKLTGHDQTTIRIQAAESVDPTDALGVLLAEHRTNSDDG